MILCVCDTYVALDARKKGKGRWMKHSCSFGFPDGQSRTGMQFLGQAFVRREIVFVRPTADSVAGVDRG